ncbi:M4 family metallopeptidase [Chryseobacterium shigense]|uniref:Neutral metalloproteinase n=1 Tax=Chryseobacterium shigense TaxID=297244 RepID=A0A841N1K2_9FLAO|nr:M4 family metallopeptidase [Chryseobacterium shigense]MBB6369033.1 Zn-dependent metalloprotease [Chryseobacterium shigense]
MKKTTTIIKALAFTLSVGFAPFVLVNAQEKKTELSVKDLPRISTSSAMGNFYASFNGQNIPTDFLITNLKKWLGTDSNHTFELVTAKTDELGIKHSVFQHYYKNVKVADELILVHEKDGKVTYVNGELTPDINLAIQQPLTKTEVENIVNADLRISDVTFADFGQVITKVYAGKGVDLHSVSQIDALSLKTLQGYMYYIDNGTKQIVKKSEKIHRHNITPVINNISTGKPAAGITSVVSPFLDTSSTSATYYKGNQQITVDSYNGAFRLKDNARNVHTLDGTGWDGSGSAASGLSGTINEYTNSTANYTAAATKPAAEVHWAMEKAHDYYVSRHNRNSYDGSGSIIRNYYNINFNRNATTGAGQTPIDGTNAAAIDQQGIVAMVYGSGLYQGQSGYFGPIVGIDVAGHEYSHLMVSRTANLTYEAESGALNESFADIFGTAIEFYSNVNPNWTIAEGIPNAGLGATYFRNMANPNAGANQIGGQQPDTYQGTNWASTAPPYTQTNDHGGVHKNSGVGNYWFYLLSQGGSGTNDNGTAFNVTGITIQKAEKIAFRTLTTYLTANSGYINAYDQSKQAAIDLYGANSNELQQVENAWCAVGLGNCAKLLAVDETIKSDLQNIKIYPNPASNGQFTIESTLKGSADYEIYDLSGKLIKSAEKLEKGINRVNGSGIQAGVYLIKINADGNVISKKIVVK